MTLPTTKWVAPLARIAAALLVSVLVLLLIAHLTTGRTATESGRRALAVLRNVAPTAVATYLVLGLCQAFFRAWRYRILIAADRQEAVPGWGLTWLVTLTRNMMVDLLPARLGELAYIGMMNKGAGVSGRACVSSLTVSVLFDMVALLGVIAAVAGSVLTEQALRGWLAATLAGTVAIVAVGGVVLFAGLGLAGRMLGLFARLPLVGSLAQRLAAWLGAVQEAVRATGRGQVLWKVVLLSLAVRALKYGSLVAAFRAVVDAGFPALQTATLTDTLCALLSGEGTASLPLPAFMSFGVYEAGGTVALTLRSFPKEEAPIVMFTLHLFTQVVDYLVGTLALVVFLLTARRRVSNGAAHAAARAGRALVLAVAVCGLAAAAGLGGLSWYRAWKRGPTAAPPRGAAVRPTAAEEQRLRRMLRDLQGFVVWSSNRAGNHDLWLMELPKGQVRRLTSHPHVDYFPRVAPDGTRIAFARSREPWVSQRNHVNWDVWVLDLKTGAERRIIEQANAPGWGDGGRTIWVQHRGTNVVACDLETGEATVRFRAGQGDLSASAILETPSVCERQPTLAVTLRGGMRGTGLLDQTGRFRRLAGGCQLTWAPDGSFLYAVNHGGRQRNAFFRLDPKTGRQALWLDLPGEFSHEYFPRLSADGRYLVFAASAGGHEPDCADYEIFLWKVGEPAAEAVRLTFHTGNDCWPDIWLEQTARR